MVFIIRKYLPPHYFARRVAGFCVDAAFLTGLRAVDAVDAVRLVGVRVAGLATDAFAGVCVTAFAVLATGFA